MSDVSVREATADEYQAVAAVLDGAMLETAGLSDAITAGRALVAVDEGRVLGALVYSRADDRGHEDNGGHEDNARHWGGHVEAVAVRRGRRGQGIGTALVTAAANRLGDVTAEFDASVRPFYESLGFTIESGDRGRLRGTHRPER